MKCDKCFNSRTVVSENGYHSACCLSESDSINCLTGKESMYVEKKHKLSEGQIQNLEDDGFFDDISAENYRLSVELYYED